MKDSKYMATGEWLRGEGPESDIVISSRLRLARNVAGFKFLYRASSDERSRINALLCENIRKAGVADDMIYYDLESVNAIERSYLVERHLISRELADSRGPRSVAVGRDESLSIMVNEEDHLRIQVLQSGFRLREALQCMNEVDDKLSVLVDYAFSPQYGYLTACPTNVGTGIRVSVMLHLPALEWTKQLRKVFKAVNKMNLAVRGLYGEGTQASGDFYQVSNQVTLGKTEEEIISTVESVVKQIIRYERQVRQALVTDSRTSLEDRVWRAYGMLKSARVISSDETMDLLSSVRMGVNMGLIGEVSIETVNELFIQTQPAHLQKREGREIDTTMRDATRARFIRSRLSN
ncbi:MAG: protein arginine kinase [Planctomycetota bacterium]|nr:MAG: protein arginine kinase [Planctomycetota bacterium]